MWFWNSKLFQPYIQSRIWHYPNRMPQKTINIYDSIGNIIKKQFEEQGISMSLFEEQLCCDRTNIYSIFNRERIDTELLKKTSIVLNHDIFKYYSEELMLNCSLSEKQDAFEWKRNRRFYCNFVAWTKDTICPWQMQQTK